MTITSKLQTNSGAQIHKNENVDPDHLLAESFGAVQYISYLKLTCAAQPA
jgi:hypothetical protein